MGRMPYRRVNDLMASPGICVHRGTGLGQVAELLAKHDITAVPVVDEDECPVGVVADTDLRHHEARLPGAQNREDATAGELMTSPAVIARPQWTVVEAARAMQRRRVKRLPVVNEAEQLIGFIGRNDLLRVFLREDHAVREEIVAEVLNHTLGMGPSQVTVTVNDGLVTLQGIVDHRTLLPVVDRLVRGVDGVVAVRNLLAYRADANSGWDSQAG
jgi:CBS-domain-containing membrane protein